MRQMSEWSNALHQIGGTMQPMEVGSRALREVEFRQQLRGYHQDDVDKFLEEVAAGIEVLQDQLRQANERAARAEAARRAVRGQPAEDDLDEDSIRRTLVLAQRTAGLAVREAKDEARRLVGEAEARARELIAAAEQSVERRLVEGRNELREEVARLTGARAELAGQVASLQDSLEDGRRRARESLERALALLDEPVSPYTPAQREIQGPGPRPANGSELPATGARAANQARSPRPGLEPETTGLVTQAATPIRDRSAQADTDLGPVPAARPEVLPGPSDRDDPEATRVVQFEPDRSSAARLRRSRVFDAELPDS